MNSRKTSKCSDDVFEIITKMNIAKKPKFQVSLLPYHNVYCAHPNSILNNEYTSVKSIHKKVLIVAHRHILMDAYLINLADSFPNVMCFIKNDTTDDAMDSFHKSIRITNDTHELIYSDALLTKYNTVIWYDTLCKINSKQILSKYIYVVPDRNYSWKESDINIIVNNNKYIDHYVFASEHTKNLFTKNVVDCKNYTIIEYQIPVGKLSAVADITYGLCIAYGDYENASNHHLLVEQFNKKLTSNKVHSMSLQLEIYGKIVDPDYYKELKELISKKNIVNIKLLTDICNFENRLKEAEYYCSHNNGKCAYNLTVAMMQKKRIINTCNDPSSLLRFYPFKQSNFDDVIMNDRYILPDYVFANQYNQLLYGTTRKKYVGQKKIGPDRNDSFIIHDMEMGFCNKLSPGISFLLRIKNEGKYLFRNIYSIYDYADEIVIIDNNSTDDTNDILDYLELYYDKIFVYHYDININKIRDNLSNQYRNRIGTYYNWGLSKVTRYNVIKWDGDFEAITHNLKAMIDRYKIRFRTDKFSLWFSGITRFYENITNLQPYYDEYRCFSRLNGFKWADTKVCESSMHFVSQCGTRLISGYDNTNGPVRLGDLAKEFDFNRKPIFIEYKDKSDYKDVILDERCSRDNIILINYESSVIKNNRRKIIYIVSDTKIGIGGSTTFDNLLYQYLSYIDNDVRTITCDDDTISGIKYLVKKIDTLKDYDVKIFMSTLLFDDKTLHFLGNLNFVELYGITHSDVSYYNKYFTQNHNIFKKIFTVNNFTRTKYTSHGVNNVFTLRNTIPLLYVGKNIVRRPRKIIFFSRTSYDKNLIMMMYAIDKLAGTYRDIMFDVYADLTDTLKYYRDHMKNKNCIRFMGHTHNKKVYLDYDLCVLPSVSEGCSYNILESINYEIPIICTNIEANKEIIGDKLPMFDFGNLDKLSTSIYIDNYNKYLEFIGYEFSKKNNLYVLTPHITQNREKMFVFERNIDNICDTIENVYNNYDKYLAQTKLLKMQLADIHYDPRRFIYDICTEMNIKNFLPIY